MADDKKTKAAPEVIKSPERIRMLRVHGFIDDNGRHRQWAGGEVIDDPDEIALLTQRGAVFEVA